MSLSAQLEKNQRQALEAAIEQQCARIARMLEKDLRTIEDAAASGGKHKKAKTKGKYNRGTGELRYRAVIGKTALTLGAWDAGDALNKIAEDLLKHSPATNPLHHICGDNAFNVKLSYSSSKKSSLPCDPVTETACLFKESIILTVKIDVTKPYSAPTGGRLHAKSDINAANWPIATLLPAPYGLRGQALRLIDTRGLEDDLACEVQADSAKRAQAALDTVKTQAKALRDYVLESFDEETTLGWADRLHRRDIDHQLTQHIAALTTAARDLPGDAAKDACVEFMRASTSAFWLGRAWHASADAAAKTGTPRVAAYVRMRDHLRNAWAAATPDSEQDLPLIMREAESMPAEVMRAVRARYEAAWRSTSPEDAIGGYIAGTVGLRTSLDTLHTAAANAFNAAAQKQTALLAQKTAKPAVAAIAATATQRTGQSCG